ncbi:MAG: class I SAM-dependent methyltransferase [Acutalibacteraceae bacterium]
MSHTKRPDLFERLCAREHVQPRSVLDLACGTGSLSLLLARRGYRVIGVDLSSEHAGGGGAEGTGPATENRPFFICQPMQRLRLAEPVDAVIHALDSLNYVTKPADCRKTFRRVYDALTPGGLFVFDINTPAKLRPGLGGQVFLDETDDTYCVWRTEFDEKKRACCRCCGAGHFSVWKGALWQRSFRRHIEYAYEPAELQRVARGGGLHPHPFVRRPRAAAPEGKPSSASVCTAKKADHEKEPACARHHDEGRLCPAPSPSRHDRRCRARTSRSIKRFLPPLAALERLLTAASAS